MRSLSRLVARKQSWQTAKQVKTLAKETLLRVRPDWVWNAVRVVYGYPEPEMELLEYVCQPGRISIDVGANYGGYTHYLLQHSASCVAFEPLDFMASLLRSGYGDRLRLEQVALSDREGVTELRMPRGQLGFSTIEPTNNLIGKVNDPGRIETTQVSVRTLDSYDIGPVGFIKIDVEGHELQVVKGARKTIETHEPALLIEVEERHRKGSVQAVYDELATMGYQAAYLENSKLCDFESFDLATHQNPNRPTAYVRNFVFAKESAMERLRQGWRQRHRR